MEVRRLVAVSAVGLAGAVAFTAVTALGGSSGSGSAPLFAVLHGGSEVAAGSGVGQSNAGDPDGVGSATVVVVSPTRICYSIVVSGISPDPAAAHIHKGASGIAGPVVVPLQHPTKGNPGTSSGCVTASRSVVSGIQRNPGNWYVNVHNADYPGGAVRGQLF